MIVTRCFKNPSIVIILLWLLLTAFNIDKAFHADDGFHLEAAKHIISDPLHPMSGIIRWDQPEPLPMYKANQPPLLFYMLAGAAAVFGYSEIALHLLISVFAFFAVFWFYKLSELYGSSKPILLLALLGLNPAFIVNQNIMTDTPILSLIIGGTYYLLLAEKMKQHRYNVVAILLLSMGLFIKYSVLPILAAVTLIFIIKKQYKSLWLLLIPIGLLALWSVWNYTEFGGFHFFSRSGTPRFSILENLWAFIACLGSVAPFSVLLLNYILRGRLSRVVVYAATLVLAILTAYGYFSPIKMEETISVVLDKLFFANGLIVIISILAIFYNELKEKGFIPFLQTNQGSLFIMLGAIAAFMILIAPFIGTRHLLLTFPFILLLSEPAIQISKKWLLSYSVLLTLLLGILIGNSEWQYADFYRKTAHLIMKTPPQGTTVWASGSGGWQWYAQYNGMKEYTVETANVKPGDYIIIASKTFHYKIDPNIKVALLGKVWGDPVTPLTYLSASHNYSMYYTDFEKPSWTLSKKPVDTVFVLQCVGNK